MKILLIGATHGNEPLGTKFYEHLLRKHSPILEYVHFIVGNPRAYAENVRYTETDLNRSYGESGFSYESTRAKEIKQYIRLNKPDIVVDMHTTNCIQQPCLIISNIDGDMKKRFLSASHIGTLVIMPKGNDIVSHVDSVIAYEIQNVAIKPSLFEAIEQDLIRFLAGSEVCNKKVLYQVIGKILKAEVSNDEVLTLKNFTMSKFGYVPVLVGDNSYKAQTEYLGFKAGAPREIEV